MVLIISGNLRIPSNLNLEAIIEQQLATIKIKDLQDYLAIFISILVQKHYIQPDSNHDYLDNSLGDMNSYFNLSSQFLRLIHRDYNKCLSFLVKSGVIETDNSFFIGKKSKGYRLSKSYRGRSQAYQIKSKRALDAIKRFNSSYSRSQQQEISRKIHVPMKAAFKRLRINKKGANHFVDELEDRLVKRVSKIGLKTEKCDEINFRIAEMIDSYRFSIEFLEVKNWFIKDKYGRVHTNLTNMPKELRNFITMEGEKLLEIDLKSSQPYLIQTILTKPFWSTYRTGRRIRLEQFNKEILNRYNRNKHQIPSLMLDTSSENHAQKVEPGSNYLRYMEGDVYTEFQNYLSNKHGKRLKRLRIYLTRDDIKKVVLFALYCSRATMKMKTKFWMIWEFYELFPELRDVANFIKAEKKEDFPALLQRIESYLIIDKCCGHLIKENKGIPIFTIHDSIITTAKFLERAKETMERKLTDATGFKPKLEIKEWLPENCDHLINDEEYITKKVNKLLAGLGIQEMVSEESNIYEQKYLRYIEEYDTDIFLKCVN